MFTAAPSHSALPHSVFATNDLRTFRGGMDRDVLRRLLVITVSRTVPEERIEYIGLRVAQEEQDLLLDCVVEGAKRFISAAISPNLRVHVWPCGSGSLVPILFWLGSRKP
jgi:hypothetical protein